MNAFYFRFFISSQMCPRKIGRQDRLIGDTTKRPGYIYIVLRILFLLFWFYDIAATAATIDEETAVLDSITIGSQSSRTHEQ